ncbi:MAG: hypothetical protein HYV28_16055 [Ignavibacteriales bacterium]|nr:hypothetical protein [Ignavibacteriales bacterium]
MPTHKRLKRGLSAVYFPLLLLMATSFIYISYGLLPLDNAGKVFGKEYFPYYLNKTMIYKTPFGEATTKVTLNKGIYSVKNDGEKFAYHQDLLIGSTGIEIKRVYQKFNLLAFITKENSVTYSKPVMRMPMPLTEGRTWFWSGMEYVNGDSDRVYVNGKIIGIETVRVPAGQYQALKIETIFKHEDSGNNKITDWIAPNIGIVKTKIEINGGGLIGFIRTVMGYDELVFELKEIK